MKTVKLEYSETLIRFITVEFEVNDDVDLNQPEQLDHQSQEPIFEKVQEDGWDSEEIIDTSYEICIKHIGPRAG